LGVVEQAEQLYDAYIGVLHACQKASVIQNTHPVIDAMVAVVIHLIHATAMLHKGLCDDVRGGGGECIQFYRIGNDWVYCKLKDDKFSEVD